MKKFILITSIAFWAALPANAQSRIVVGTPAKRIVVPTPLVNAAPIARIVVVKHAPIVAVKPALRMRVVVVHH